ncbi:hypothetical protein [Macrococcoides canis]|uniref:hypothetical protein n=1 Tax=Macrococcoides canis TaxID=1855823 RepID=UPI00165E758A|nr:hypothetical protein [Macrococcus canis]QNR07164.1 hypothetical protein GL258_02500 [Macrococcus canis]
MKLRKGLFLKDNRNIYIAGDQSLSRYKMIKTLKSPENLLGQFVLDKLNQINEYYFVIYSNDNPVIYAEKENILIEISREDMYTRDYDKIYIPVNSGQLPYSITVSFIPYYQHVENFNDLFCTDELSLADSLLIWNESFPYGKKESAIFLDEALSSSFTKEQIVINIIKSNSHFSITDIDDEDSAILMTQSFFSEKAAIFTSSKEDDELMKFLSPSLLKSAKKYSQLILKNKNKDLNNIKTSIEMFFMDDLNLIHKDIDWMSNLEFLFRYRKSSSKHPYKNWLRDIKDLVDKTFIETVTPKIYIEYELKNIMYEDHLSNEVKSIIEELYNKYIKVLRKQVDFKEAINDFDEFEYYTVLSKNKSKFKTLLQEMVIEEANKRIEKYLLDLVDGYLMKIGELK